MRHLVYQKCRSPHPYRWEGDLNGSNGWVERSYALFPRMGERGLIDKEAFSQSQDYFLAREGDLSKLGAFYWWESETVVKNLRTIVLNPLIGPNGHQMIGVPIRQKSAQGTSWSYRNAKTLKSCSLIWIGSMTR